MDNLKSRSIFYDLLRKTKHKYYTTDKPRVVYDFDHSRTKLFWGKKFKFLSYSDALKLYDIDELMLEHKEKIDYYLKNVDILYEESKKLGAKPIFINQVTAYGGYDQKHLVLNYALKNILNL